MTRSGGRARRRRGSSRRRCGRNTGDNDGVSARGDVFEHAGAHTPLAFRTCVVLEVAELPIRVFAMRTADDGDASDVDAHKRPFAAALVQPYRKIVVPSGRPQNARCSRLQEGLVGFVERSSRMRSDSSRSTAAACLARVWNRGNAASACCGPPIALGDKLRISRDMSA